MLISLLLSAMLMGLAGTPHCLAMCGVSCAAAAGRHGWAFHAGRVLAYSAAGAVAAASIGSLGAMGQAVAALRPLWTLVHVAALVLGLLLLWRGRQPAWMEHLGRTRSTPAHRGGGWQRMTGPAASAGAGLAWVAWPCGLLQSALLVAALANSAAGGALVMAGFALASALGLVLGPAAWARWVAPSAAGRVPARVAVAAAVWPVRLAGAALAGASVWALGHDLLVRLAAWCFG